MLYVRLNYFKFKLQEKKKKKNKIKKNDIIVSSRGFFFDLQYGLDIIQVL